MGSNERVRRELGWYMLPNNLKKDHVASSSAVEQRTVNAPVVGSIPTLPATIKGKS